MLPPVSSVRTAPPGRPRHPHKVTGATYTGDRFPGSDWAYDATAPGEWTSAPTRELQREVRPRLPSPEGRSGDVSC